MADTTIPPITIPAIHGPYEDSLIIGLTLLEKILDSQPPEVKAKLWEDFLAFQDRLHTFAEKVDVFHLFHAKE